MAKYFLINNSDAIENIGRVFQLDEGETIEDVLKENLTDNKNLSDLTLLEYKYYLKLEQSKRLRHFKNHFFKKICALEIGDLCRAQINDKFITLKIMKVINDNDDISFQCNSERGFICNVAAHLIYDIPAKKNSEQLRFLTNSRVIDPGSIKNRTKCSSSKFVKNNLVKSVYDGNVKYFKIRDFVLLNGIACLEVVKAMVIGNCSQCEHLREEDVCEFDFGDIEPIYYEDTIMEPLSIVTCEILSGGDFVVGDYVEFKLRKSLETFKGRVQLVVRANGIPAGIVQLTTANDNLLRYDCNQNVDLRNLFGEINSPHFIVRMIIMKKLDGKVEFLNDIPLINPQTIKTSNGKKQQDKFIIFKCKGSKHWALLKWKGYINNKYCLGCEIGFELSLGTNGTIGDKHLFECGNKRGVLIPMDDLEECCVRDGHRDLVSNAKRIDENSICCIKSIEKSV